MNERRQAILAAAADLFEEFGIARVSRRTIAAAADVPTRSVTSVGHSRSALLRQVVADLPFPPTSQRMQRQAADAADTPLETILTVAREAFGAPASVWDSRELQAVVLAPFDEELEQVVRDRIRLRWEAAAEVLSQLRGEGAVDPGVDDDAATLHLLAVGAGLALLEPLVPQTTEASAWIGLVARLLEALAATDPPGPAHEGELVPWRVRVIAHASPGATARVLRVLALLRADVITLFTHMHGVRQQLLDMIITVPEHLSRAVLVESLSSVSQQVLVARGEPDDTRDLIGRILDGAAGLVEHPDAAPQAAAELVLADSWQVLPASEGPDSSAEVMRLQWTPEQHVLLTRAGSPFVAVERSRASALLRLVEALSRAPGGSGDFGWRMQVRGGQVLSVRLARPEDAEAVAAMHTRCSEETRYQRYFAPVSEWREDRLRKIAGGHRGATLVAETEDGALVGLGNVFPEKPDGAGTAEVAVIIEDAWQGRGVGSVILRRLIELAQRWDFVEVTALVLATNTTMINLLESTGLAWERDTDPDLPGSVVRMTAPITTHP